MAGITVSWMARNLGGKYNIGFGNHHYILVIPDGHAISGGIEVKNHDGIDFFTLGAFSVGGNMEFEANNESDAGSAKESIEGISNWDVINPFDWGTQNHVVTPPGGSLIFAAEVVKLALNYQRNTASKPLPYTLTDDNCASWVNTLFKVAGISPTDRVDLGQFWGIDAAEQLEIPESYFK